MPKQCPNPLKTNEPEAGRVAGFSCYPYHMEKTETGLEHGLEIDYPWEDYADGKDYFWENCLPSDVLQYIKCVAGSLSAKEKISTERTYSKWSDVVSRRAVEVFCCSNEDHNICTLIREISESYSY